jgi:hypothetical protein
MSITLFLHILWKRLALLLSPGSIRIDGLWDRARLRTESNQELKAWKNVLLLHPRREALNNGVVVTKVEHLKDGSQHEFLRIHVLHEKSKERLAFIVDREIWPKDLKGPPDTNGEAEETEKPFLSSKKKRHATELEPSTGDEHDEVSGSPFVFRVNVTSFLDLSEEGRPRRKGTELNDYTRLRENCALL